MATYSERKISSLADFFLEVRRLRRRTSKVSLTLVGAVLSLGIFVPFSFVIFTSLKSRKELPWNPLGFPKAIELGNYVEAWQRGHFDRYFMNSVYVAVPTVIVVIVLSTLAAYAFSTMRFRGKDIVFGIILVGLAIPLDILIIPLFYQLLDMKLLNTHWAIILPTAAKIIPFGVLLLRSFMEELPSEILDAGRIDGCSTWQLLQHVVVPLSGPCLTSLLVFTFMWTWNMFFLPVVMIQEDSLRTLPIGLNYFQGKHTQHIPLLMAGATISSIPIVVIYMIFQRQFIKGIVAGAVKS
jgi:raffinose/stachyose/melibiose transport system permease protein